MAVLFHQFAAIAFNTSDVKVVDVDQAFVLVYFVAREYFSLDPFVILWETK